MFRPLEVLPDRADYFPKNVTTVVLPESYHLVRSRAYTRCDAWKNFEELSGNTAEVHFIVVVACRRIGDGKLERAKAIYSDPGNLTIIEDGKILNSLVKVFWPTKVL